MGVGGRVTQALSKCLERVLSVLGSGDRENQSLLWSSPCHVQEMQEETDDKKQEPAPSPLPAAHTVPVLASPLSELAVPHPGLSAQVGAGRGIPKAPLPGVGWVPCGGVCADLALEPGQWSLKPARAFLSNVT